MEDPRLVVDLRREDDALPERIEERGPRERSDPLVVDLFVQRLEEYYERFKGPAKYDGSTVNWLNGPLFRAVAEQLGFSVRFHSFKPYDPKSVSVIMLASPQTDVGELEVEE